MIHCQTGPGPFTPALATADCCQQTAGPGRVASPGLFLVAPGKGYGQSILVELAVSDQVLDDGKSRVGILGPGLRTGRQVPVT